MADTITNPQVISFCNMHARPNADIYTTLYHFATTAVGVWNSQGLAALVPQTTDTVADGSDVDGRGRITGNHLHALINQLNFLINDLEANGDAKLNALYNMAVNPRA
jgi:hypothetical protein